MKTQSETIGKISEALSRAQNTFEPIIRDVQAHKHKFAPLPVCLKSTRNALFENGLCVTQPMNALDDGKCIVETTLGHSSGEFFKSYTDITQLLNVSKGPNPLHAWGAVITYTRRYAYLSIIGASSEDEDNDGSDIQNSKNKNNVAQVQQNYQQVQKDPVDPLVLELMNMIKMSGCDVKNFTKTYGISSDDLSSIKRSIDNFDELLINYRDNDNDGQ